MLPAQLAVEVERSCTDLASAFSHAHCLEVPRRNMAQRIGANGEQQVRNLIDTHPQWLARAQDADFGVDLEAELARSDGERQELTGKVLKIQVKSRRTFDRADAHVLVTLEREWVDYACAFRIPVVVIAFEQGSAASWWLWVQDWALRNEESLSASASPTLTLRIPEDQTLAKGLDGELSDIAEGRSASAMVLALRGVLEVASGWENQAFARGLIELLGKTELPSRAWTIAMIVDQLTKLGPNALHWEAQQMLPMLYAIIDTAGETLTREQMLRFVQRGESYSRVGMTAVSYLYDKLPDHAASLRLADLFSEKGLDAPAWYAHMRERYAGERAFGFFVTGLPDQDLEFNGAVLRLDQETKEYIVMKYPNRGETVLLDCLIWPDGDPPAPEDARD